MAHQADQAVGFVQLYPAFSSIFLARTFILNDLFVCPRCRKQGAGSRLIQTAIAYAKQVGALRLSLSTAITNQTAQALYERTGWKRDEHFLHYHFAPGDCVSLVPDATGAIESDRLA